MNKQEWEDALKWSTALLVIFLAFYWFTSQLLQLLGN